MTCDLSKVQNNSDNFYSNTITSNRVMIRSNSIITYNIFIRYEVKQTYMYFCTFFSNIKTLHSPRYHDTQMNAFIKRRKSNQAEASRQSVQSASTSPYYLFLFLYDSSQNHHMKWISKCIYQVWMKFRIEILRFVYQEH